MEDLINELLVKVSSLDRQIKAINAALLNVKGFYIEQADGSQQGLLKFGVPPVPPEPVGTPAPVEPEPAATESEV
ncbi:hypothetical protein SEA_THUNDERCLAP_39 [Arthrobacter phage Thunderclap]|uniref:Uncharacterized protein n=10 Tax=Amigovirus amigo TaxID=1982100 RepID=A0A0U4KA42_9CAUD|nr:hypothetical protein FDH66_gp64 [Arthrobacter phage Amigo]ALY08484.1 hypothetical protein ANANSI_39 [Arthrobacter phage Anansi]ALY09098.1 hypothetical protein GORGEOUS_39 [Arthrobacter phage Gorgeous]ALY10115.1 hypothetical protein RINGS_38 [Arthrobacter phage Rings]ALY10379.1 hypothetical protein SORJUANA_39 [Arthrobacter phage SorJuana]QFG08333.1 hypothetical protein SEA_YEEZUS_38 [Arthrobacter phage Yeezus]QFG13381.1 hypothetical protein SEA_ICHOR_38 [Arthrobacter phage Ichor]QFG13899.